MKPIQIGDTAFYASRSLVEPGETVDWVDAETGKYAGRAVVLPEIKEILASGTILAKVKITELTDGPVSARGEDEDG